MKRSQAAIALIALIVVALIAVGRDGGDNGSGSPADREPVTKAPQDAVRIPFAFSPEKEKLLKPLIERFNSERREVDGQPVFIAGMNVSSGEAEAKIAKGALKPVVWSPASSLWGRLLNFEADRPYAADSNPSIVRTPLVIAMWEPMAKALGYPRKRVGFEDILRLASSNQGWAAFGKPQFGRFKLVHTNPDFSTSGLSAVVAEYYAATGKKEGLTERDVTRSKARRTVRDIERSIVHYGDTTLFVAEQMKKEGPGYASAAAMEEVTLLDFNRDRGSNPKLIAIYPKEGTFYSDNPFIVLAAPWVTEAQRKGAALFQEFLTKEISPQVAARSGFRPADLKAAPVAPLTAANGVDPAQPKRVLGLPEPRVLNRIKTAWREDRKPANVLLVLDTSGSMNDENRLENAKQGLEVFLREASPNDRLGLTIFSDKIQPVIAIAPVRENRARLQSALRDLIADGGTAVYDATARAFDTVRELNDRERINAVVILTDGEDTDSSQTAEAVTARVGAQGDSENRVRIFTIAYSAGAAGAAEALEAIATASGGRAYEGGTEDIESVYLSISSFF